MWWFLNLDEGSSTHNVKNKIKQERAVVNIASQMELPNLEIETSYKLGKRSNDKLRPLKIVLKTDKKGNIYWDIPKI